MSNDMPNHILSKPIKSDVLNKRIKVLWEREMKVPASLKSLTANPKEKPEKERVRASNQNRNKTTTEKGENYNYVNYFINILGNKLVRLRRSVIPPSKISIRASNIS